MKIVTNDYGCGTSSSILDYGLQDVCVVSEDNFEFIFDVEDDLLFIGHDFLFYLWDNEAKLKRWQSRKGKWEHWVWCFERIDAIVPAWQQKSHHSLGLAMTFCNRVLACDEDDCDKYGFDWLPQWASKRFYDQSDTRPTEEKILFSGQAGGPEYYARNELLRLIKEDSSLSSLVDVTNTKRSLTWDEYTDNLLKYQRVLNPVGILRGLNTRAFETLYSGRLLLQQTAGQYVRHENLLKHVSNIIFFKNFDELQAIVRESKNIVPDKSLYTQHSIYARMKSIGVDIT